MLAGMSGTAKTVRAEQKTQRRSVGFLLDLWLAFDKQRYDRRWGQRHRKPAPDGILNELWPDVSCFVISRRLPSSVPVVQHCSQI